jgi:DNA-binding response OmpR family regulator
VIDDDGDLDALVSAALRRRGHDVIHIRDADGALATMRATDVSCVILDVSTPGSFGLLQEKALDAGLVAIPTLLLTSDRIETTAIRHVLDILGSPRNPS